MENQEFEVLETGNMSVTLAGVAAAALAIIGLAGMFPGTLSSISAIAIGAGLILTGIAIGAERTHILTETVPGYIGSGTLSSGIGMEVITGIVSVVLGILSLLKMDSSVLLGVDTVILGLALLFACKADSRMNAYRSTVAGITKQTHTVMQETVMAAIDMQLLVGLTVITLGILAIIGIVPMILILVSFLSTGIVLAFKGTILAARLIQEHNE